MKTKGVYINNVTGAIVLVEKIMHYEKTNYTKEFSIVLKGLYKNEFVIMKKTLIKAIAYKDFTRLGSF